MSPPAVSPSAGSRLLLVGTFLSVNGGNRSVLEDLEERLTRQGFEILTVSRRRRGWARGADILATAARCRADYDLAVIDVYSGRAFLWAESVAGLLRLFGKPYVLTLRGGGLPAFSRRFPGRMRRLLSGAAAVTAPSGYLIEELKIFRPDLSLLPNPLDLDAYAFRERTAVQPRLVWLRAFHRTYNPMLAPRVLARLRCEYPDTRLWMVGPDKGDGSLEATRRVAAELGVEDRIEFPGGIAKNEVGSWLGRGDIFLNTTNIDNTPVSVLEAMASGLSVVSTNVGGIPALLTDGQDALLVPPDNPEAMAAAVRRMLSEPGLAERFSRNGRRKAERFDWSVVLPQWESLLMAAGKEVSR